MVVAHATKFFLKKNKVLKFDHSINCIKARGYKFVGTG